ncbi:four-carbon acid sugar kinase family protein [Acidimangrovimonas sediminis]|uniref:four-carbon acid sugar kinase family protein n=1 Tax=Acidimangrovimonas sediminis TaxID=2056283 RepID=UPI000C8088D2|nr:four-carbon acid sugar kinase family protein [Acidimangrovimonas sediminis]
MNAPSNLPSGPLVTWYGDDFTGSAAVMEVLEFAGLPSVLFLDIPGPELLARFRDRRGIGIASTARSHGPDWMNANLPAAFGFLDGLRAPLLHYKVCSTLDSAPDVGSIGRAAELALAARPTAEAAPVLIAAPRMRRYQAFGTLFAGAPAGVFRLDRHPVMARHPVTPMTEADVARHIGRQTDLPTGLIDLEALWKDGGSSALEGALSEGRKLLSLDTMDTATEAAAGGLIWRNRDRMGVVIGSQGVEYALTAHWRAEGLIPEVPMPGGAGRVDRIVAVSGSVSPVTAAQIEWSAENGFGIVRIDTLAMCGAPQDRARAEAGAIEAALSVLERGQSPLVISAAGPGDQSVAALRTAQGASGLTMEEVNRRLGQSLGRVLDRVLLRSGCRRAVISGGDTSGHGTRELGLEALTALAPTIPGAALFRGHGGGAHDGLELALKGGQMGSADYFGWIRAGGGASAG